MTAAHRRRHSALLKIVAAIVVGYAAAAPFFIPSLDLDVFTLAELAALGVAIMLMVIWLSKAIWGAAGQRRGTLIALACLPATTLTAFAFAVPDHVAWLFYAERMKREAAAHPWPGRLPSTVWGRHSFPFGIDTTYVVNDPSDRLGDADQRSEDGRTGPLPCRNGDVEARLERGWYLVKCVELDDEQ